MGKKKLLIGGFTSLIFRLGGDTTTVPAAAAASGSATTTKPANPSSSSSSSWAWPSCKKQQQQPRTDSLRVDGSVYFDSADSLEFTHSSEDNNSESFSTTSDHDDNHDDEGSERLIRGLVRSSVDRRLFVEPGGDTSSILGGRHGAMDTTTVNHLKEGSVAMAMESHDPYVDFKESMEEMVAAHGLKEWECLEELLAWYLRVNGKKTHGYIVGAFVDLLLGLAAAADHGHDDEEEESGDLLPSSSSCCGSSSSLSLSTSSRNCYEIEEVVLEDRSR